jgi:serine protease
LDFTIELNTFKNYSFKPLYMKTFFTRLYFVCLHDNVNMHFMNAILSSAIIILHLNFAFSQSGNLFYYAFDEKIELNPVQSKYTLEFIEAEDEQFLEQNSITNTKIAEKVFEVSGNITEIQEAGEGIYTVSPVFTTNDGLILRMKNEILLSWNENISENQKTNLENQYGLTLIKSTRLFNVYKIMNPLAVSQLIYESGNAVFSYPVFLSKAELLDYIPNDEYFSKQWYLNNTGQQVNDGHSGTIDADINATEAWEITQGSSEIVIAIIDQGVTSNHPDLPNSRQVRLSGSNFDNTDGLSEDNPSPISDENHGNACAGIAAAEMDNNEGIAGIAPNCKIMPIKIPFGGSSTEYAKAEAITFAVDNGANVISNSWAYFSSNPNLFPVINIAIQDALDQGVVVIFGAGNTANHFDGSNGYVAFPANANIDELITVGASDRNDEQSNYSPTSGKIDISAPSHSAYDHRIEGEAFNIWTIDIPGDNGYNPWFSADWGLPAFNEIKPSTGTNHLAYTGRMGGTSASTAEVAGVAALILSVNPDLPVHLVNDILYTTADKVGEYDYEWDITNPGHSKELGNGRLNAFKAVTSAQGLMVKEIDLYTKDVPEDLGIEPDQVAEFLWTSNDIWVRNQPNGFNFQTHENPEYSPTDPVYVYVRVRNNGYLESLGTEQIKIYWAKAATALTWPDYWNGSITEPALMGEEIGSQLINSIEAGGNTILEFEWYPPNPNDYDFNEEPWHFCLLSRIVADNDPMNDELWDGTWNLGHNVKYNNNIAWKNISIVDLEEGIIGSPNGKTLGAAIAIGNASKTPEVFDLEFKSPRFGGNIKLTDVAEITVKMDDVSWRKWIEGGTSGRNIKISKKEPNLLIITGDNARIENMSFEPYERGLIDLKFNFLVNRINEKNSFKYNVVQSNSSTKEFLGGEQYYILTPNRSDFEAEAGEDTEISKNESIVISAAEINENATYNWYDAEGNLIHSGKDFSITPEMTKKYKLEVIADADGFKDYDEIEVKVKEAEIKNISPNPASDYVSISYDIESMNSAYLIISHPFGTTSDNFILDNMSDEILIDVSNYQSGVYGVTLVANGQVVDAKGLVIE